MIAPAATARTAGHGLLCPISPLQSSSLPADRRGRLRNGARPGDFLAAPRCGAHTRAGGGCRQPAMKNGRCRMHGGLSTGPRTAEGRARCAAARRTHGFYSAETTALRRAAAAHCCRMDAIFASVKVRGTAGHGLLPPSLSRRAGSSARILPTSATVPLRVSPSREVRRRRPHALRWAWGAFAAFGTPAGQHRPTPPVRPAPRLGPAHAVGRHGARSRRRGQNALLRWAWAPSSL
jgi:hypothetical protein